MNEAQARKQASRDSKTLGPQFVVWVFDQGREIFDADQARRAAPLIHVEAVYVGGVEVAHEVAA